MCVHQEILKWILYHMSVDDLNIIGNTRDINEARNHLKTKFEMKDFGEI